MSRALTLRMLLVASVATLGACGEDARELKKADFIRRADAICREANVAVDKLQDEVNPDDEKAFAELTAKAFDLQLDALDRVKSLGTPDSDAKAVNEFLTEAEESFAQARDADTEFNFGLAAKRIENLAPVAAKLGFAVCGTR